MNEIEGSPIFPTARPGFARPREAWPCCREDGGNPEITPSQSAFFLVPAHQLHCLSGPDELTNLWPRMNWYYVKYFFWKFKTGYEWHCCFGHGNDTWDFNQALGQRSATLGQFSVAIAFIFSRWVISAGVISLKLFSNRSDLCCCY